MIGVAAATAGGVEVGLSGKPIGAVPMIQYGVEARQTGARAQKQREQQERPESHRLRRLTHFRLRQHSDGAGTGEPPHAVGDEQEHAEHAHDDRARGQVVVK